jgi:predicted nucleic acid-binding Zn ribbon protein
MSDKPLVVCPECHGHTLVRLIEGGAGIVFKGSGFYINDYKKSGLSPTHKAGKPEASPAAKHEKKQAPEKKSDKKPEK